MNIGNRILFNTMILYSKIIITMFISLFTVPIIMNSLGISDFGLYNLIAGVIIMLAFLNASMTVSTQRYMSIGMGVSKNNNIKQIFNVSLVLHIIIGLFIILLFEIGSYFLFDGNLNIDTNRIYAAKIIYQFLVISTFFSILSVPFDAIINAHENMLALSILEIIESILKLLVIVFLIKTSFDKLIFYGFCLAIISIFVTFLKWLFCLKTYPVCKVELKKSFNLNLFIEMFGFAGWNTFGAVAMLARNQGIAIILNIFFGTVMPHMQLLIK